jgi:branched-chain amino acid transport system permease protein
LSDELIQLLPSVLLEGLLLGCVYAMIALGYTMVYGVLGLINFAHSEVFMIGAVTGVEVYRYLGPHVGNPYLLALLAMLMAAAISGGVAMAIERLAYRPLRRRSNINRLVPSHHRHRGVVLPAGFRAPDGRPVARRILFELSQ